MSNDVIEVALCLNAAYAPHAAVLMNSIIAKTRRRVRFHVLDDDTPEPAQAKIIAMARAAGGDCIWQHVSKQPPPEATAFGWSPSASYRLFLPEMLPDSVTRVIYLDVDTVVLDDIGELWDFDLRGCAIGAVRDVPACEEHVQRRLEMFGHDDCFNSGLLLMDLAAWRRDKLSDRVWAAMIAAGGAYSFPDQDALNAVFTRAWRQLPERWNIQRPATKWTARQLGLSARAYLQLALSPGMVHFTGSPKPWAGKQRHPFNWAYWRAARNTPFFEQIKDSSRGGYRKAASRISAYGRFLLRIGVRALG